MDPQDGRREALRRDAPAEPDGTAGAFDEGAADEALLGLQRARTDGAPSAEARGAEPPGGDGEGGDGEGGGASPMTDPAPTGRAATATGFAGPQAAATPADTSFLGPESVPGIGLEDRRHDGQTPLRLALALGIGLIAFAAAAWVEGAAGGVLAAFGVGAALTAGVAAALYGRRALVALRARLRLQALSALYDADEVPTALTDQRGAVLAGNQALRDGNQALRGGAGSPSGLPPEDAGILFDSLGEDGVAAEIYRLIRAARSEGAAESVALSHRGVARRVRVDRVAPDRLLWRLLPRGPQGPSGFASALDAMGLPALLRDQGGLRPNRAARRLMSEAELDAVSRLDAPPDQLAAADGAALGVLPLRAPDLPPERSSTSPGEAATSPDDPARDASRSALGWLLLPPLRQAGDAAQILDRLPVALARLTLDGRLISCNESARRLLGPAAAPGARLETLAEGLGRSIPERLAEAARGRASGRTEIARGKREDRETFLQISLTLVEHDGKPALAAVMADATELKTLEAQFVQSQKMQAVGQLAGGVAHDFNNLLTAIAGHTDLLLMRKDASDADHSDLVQIRQNANRAAALVRQMLAFSRKQTLTPTVINMTETLTELSHLLNRLLGEKVRLKLEHAEDLGLVRVDERQFEQVVMNLVVNARDAMPGGGEVRIRTRNALFDEEYRRDRAVVPAGRYVVVEVSDNGHGIPADRIGQIFEPFYTTKKQGEGTGLGLSTAYGIVKQTGGFIFADSPPGSGAVFTVYLPRLEEGAGVVAAPEAPAREAASDAAQEGRVLLVEDEAPVRSFASRALRLRGYTVSEAENAEEALELLADPDFHVDVIVSDVVMPGMDGPSWVKTARESRPDVAVVFVSGYAEGAFRRSLEGLEAFVFLPKPYSLADLSTAIREARKEKEAAA